MKKVSDEVLLECLLSSHSQTEAAQALGIHPNTVYNRLKKKDFKEKYEKRKRELLEATSNQLLTANTSAAQTLVQLLDSPQDSCRLGAASKILTYSKEYLLFSSLSERIATLEKALDSQL